jgi:hypothetical protein
LKMPHRVNQQRKNERGRRSTADCTHLTYTPLNLTTEAQVTQWCAGPR